MSDSTVTLYDVKSLIFAGNLTNFPVLQSNSAECHPQVIVHPSNFPSDRLEPECVHESSVAQYSPLIFATKISLPSIDTLIIFPGVMSVVLPAIIFPMKFFYLVILNIFSYMKSMKIREANASDKISVLKFCKNTFSWGDYIDHVWDFWLDEGHLFLSEKQFPVGICHAFYSKNQVWIEGIRINSNFRHQKIASKLVKHAETVGKERNILSSCMLIDVENFPSLLMANSLNYDVFQTWHFYSLEPKLNTNHNVRFEKSLNRQFYSHYVNSWRWLPIDDDTLLSFYEQNRIVKFGVGDKKSLAILTDSDHFDRTLIVTLFSNFDNSTLQILSFLQNYSMENNYERIQILTKDKLPIFDSLECKISFNLMKKSLV